MPSHRDFESAAEGRPVNRHDHRLRGILDREQQGMQAGARLFARRDLSELPNIRPGDERAPGADDHNRAYFRILRRGLNTLAQALRNAGAQRIDRRIFDSQDSHIVVPRVFYKVAHEFL